MSVYALHVFKRGRIGRWHANAGSLTIWLLVIFEIEKMRSESCYFRQGEEIILLLNRFEVFHPVLISLFAPPSSYSYGKQAIHPTYLQPKRTTLDSQPEDPVIKIKIKISILLSHFYNF